MFKGSVWVVVAEAQGRDPHPFPFFGRTFLYFTLLSVDCERRERERERVGRESIARALKVYRRRPQHCTHIHSHIVRPSAQAAEKAHTERNSQTSSGGTCAFVCGRPTDRSSDRSSVHTRDITTTVLNSVCVCVCLCQCVSVRIHCGFKKEERHVPCFWPLKSLALKAHGYQLLFILLLLQLFVEEDEEEEVGVSLFIFHATFQSTDLRSSGVHSRRRLFYFLILLPRLLFFSSFIVPLQRAAHCSPVTQQQVG